MKVLTLKTGHPQIFRGCLKNLKETDILVLPTDLLITSVETLGPEILRRMSYDPGDYIISRPHFRSQSIVVEASAVKFLEQFRSPMTIVEAVIDHSNKEGRGNLRGGDAVNQQNARTAIVSSARVC